MSPIIRNEHYDADNNVHPRTLNETLGVPKIGRCSGGGNPTINIDVGVKVDVRTGQIEYHTDRLVPARAYNRY